MSKVSEYTKRIKEWKAKEPRGKDDTFANRIFWESNRPSGFWNAVKELGLIIEK